MNANAAVMLDDDDDDDDDDGSAYAAAVQALSPVLLRTLTLTETAALVLDRAMALVGATGASVDMAAADGRTQRLASRGHDRAEVEVSLDLVVEGRPLGRLELRFAESRVSVARRRALQSLANVAARVLERARCSEEEMAARERNVQLQRVTSALSRAVTAADVALAGVELIASALGAYGGAFWTCARAGELSLAATCGAPLQLDGRGGAEAAMAGREVTVGDAPSGADVALPLIAAGRAIGALVLGFADERRFTGIDRAFIGSLADKCAQALDRARLYGEARAAEEQSRRVASRLTILVEASEAYAEALTDYPRLCALVAESVAMRMGDGCMVGVLDEAGEEVVPMALHDADPERARRVREAMSHAPLRNGVGAPLHALLARTNPTLMVGEEVLALATALGPELVAVVTQFGARSAILAPLRVRGRAIGGLFMWRVGASFEELDVELARGLADRVAVAVENARLYAQATDAVRVRDDFLSVAGHELRTPLTALLLQVHSLLRASREEHASARVIQRAEQATRSGARLARLIDDLLDVSRVTAGKLAVVLEDTDLGELVKETLARHAEDLARADCALTSEIEDGVRGSWDRARLEQVVTNLVTNALKYGRGQPILVKVERLHDGARLVVQDHGVGIAQADQARIFDRFERAASVRHFGGLGLGLWIVRQIVEAHGGTSRVESASGVGATFIVELPRVPQCRLGSAPPAG